MNAFWSSCLQQLEQELPPQQFNTWIKALRLEKEDAANGHDLKIVAPNRFVLQWVRERYLRRLEDMARQFFAEPVQISINLPEASEAERLEIMSPAIQGRIAVADRPNIIPAYASPDAAYEKTRLNSTFTFDTLVTGRANDLARAAAISGGAESGHVLQPAVRLWRGRPRQNPPDACPRQRSDAAEPGRSSATCMPTTITQTWSAPISRNFDVFKRYYRSLDLLLIDDIQFFNNKNAHAGRILLCIQRADRSKEADRHHLRYLSQGHHRPGRTPDLALRLGSDGRHRAARARNAGRHPEKEG
jgi:chromosomal replication initiator protein